MRFKLSSGVVPVATLLAALAVSQTANAQIVNINQGDFTDPQVLDFESATLGTISSTDPLFTNFGITSLTAVGSVVADGFGVRTNSSRALWHDGTNLVVVDPGTGNLADTVEYTIDFSAPITRFGLGVHDQQGSFTVTFFSGATNLGTGTFNASDPDLASGYFESVTAFDRVVISDGGSGGFAIDNLTTDASAAAPEPGSVVLLAIGGAFGLLKRRRKLG